MDYYSVLRVSRNASHKDIEKAYERLVKESRYDSSIDRQSIETAYRILSDLVTKAQYDSRQTLKSKRINRKDKKQVNYQAFLSWLTLPHLLWVLGISLVFTAIFYWFRFGYLMQDFQAGDVLFEKANKNRFGQILKVDPAHRFGDHIEKAYQIRLDSSQIVFTTEGRVLWIPQNSVKARCYRP